MSKITFLGFASNSFSAINSVSFIYDNGTDKLLVDCGATVLYNIHSIIENLVDINYCFVSHGHFDHFLGLPYFIIGRNLDAIAKKKRNPNCIISDLTILIDSELKNVLLLLLDVCHPDVKKLHFNINFVEINDSTVFETNNFVLSAKKVDHTVKTFALSIFENNNKILSYSSDTLYDNKIIDYMRHSKYLVIEGMVPESEETFSQSAKHATFTDALKVSNKLNPKQAFLVHLQPRYRVEIDKIEESLQQQANAKIEFPKIGVWYELCI